MTDAVEMLRREYYNTPEDLARLDRVRQDVLEAGINYWRRRVEQRRYQLREAEAELDRLRNAPLSREDQAAVTAQATEQWAKDHP